MILENQERDDGSTIRAAAERNKKRVIKLGESGAMPELDAVARRLPPEEFEALVTPRAARRSARFVAGGAHDGADLGETHPDECG